MIKFEHFNKVLNSLNEGNNGEEYQYLLNAFTAKLDPELKAYVTIGIRKILGFVLVVDMWGAQEGGNRTTHSQLASYLMHVDEGDTYFNYLHGRLRDLKIRPAMARKQKTQEDAVVKLAQWFNKNKKPLLDHINSK